MAEIEPSDLLATQPLHRARCLRGTQVATVAKQGGDEAFSWVIDLGFKAGQWSEQSMQVEPLLGLGQQIQYVDGRHILLESCLQQSQLRRSEEHTSELQSLMRISYAVFCLKKTNTTIAQL